MADLLASWDPAPLARRRAARDDEDKDREEDEEPKVEPKSKKKLDPFFTMESANLQEERLIDYCLMFIRLLKNKSITFVSLFYIILVLTVHFLVLHTPGSMEWTREDYGGETSSS